MRLKYLMMKCLFLPIIFLTPVTLQVFERQLRWARSVDNQGGLSPLPSLNNSLLQQLCSGIGEEGRCVVVRKTEEEEVGLDVWIIDQTQVKTISSLI